MAAYGVMTVTGMMNATSVSTLDWIRTRPLPTASPVTRKVTAVRYRAESPKASDSARAAAGIPPLTWSRSRLHCQRKPWRPRESPPESRESLHHAMLVDFKAIGQFDVLIVGRENPPRADKARATLSRLENAPVQFDQLCIAEERAERVLLVPRDANTDLEFVE